MVNAYPELPRLPYRRTSVAMLDLIAHLRRAAFPLEVRRATYIVFRNESGNGRSGVNNNYSGMQADGARWPASLDHYFVGTTTTPENQTGDVRTFLCFARWEDSADCLAERLAARGIYVGGRTHLVTQVDVATPTDLATAYHREWVTGSATSSPGSGELGAFLSMYAQAETFFA